MFEKSNYGAKSTRGVQFNFVEIVNINIFKPFCQF